MLRRFLVISMVAPVVLASLAGGVAAEEVFTQTPSQYPASATETDAALRAEDRPSIADEVADVADEGREEDPVMRTASELESVADEDGCSGGMANACE